MGMSDVALFDSPPALHELRPRTEPHVIGAKRALKVQHWAIRFFELSERAEFQPGRLDSTRPFAASFRIAHFGRPFTSIERCHWGLLFPKLDHAVWDILVLAALGSNAGSCQVPPFINHPLDHNPRACLVESCR